MTQHEILNRLFLEAAGDLLSANGIKAEVVTELGADVHSKLSYVSVLGATGEGVALSSMMTVDSALLVSLHPLGITEIPTADLEDWCRELNNQLVGRVKNKLLRYGVVVALGLPVLLRGTDVSAVATPDLTVSKHAIRTSSGKISLSLATLVDEDLVLIERESADEEVMLEGVVSLF
jgi:hypothetical protein